MITLQINLHQCLAYTTIPCYWESWAFPALTTDAENSLPFALALMCFGACSESWKEIKRASFFFFPGQFVSRVFIHAKEIERERSVRSWCGRTEVDALCGLYVHQLNPTQSHRQGNNPGPEKRGSGADFLFSLIPLHIFKISICVKWDFCDKKISAAIKLPLWAHSVTRGKFMASVFGCKNDLFFG